MRNSFKTSNKSLSNIVKKKFINKLMNTIGHIDIINISDIEVLEKEYVIISKPFGIIFPNLLELLNILKHGGIKSVIPN